VRILDRARKMVRLSGLRPDIDIPIVFSGTRPGEKLFEEVKALEENTTTTPHAQIRVFSGPPPPGVMRRTLDELERATEARDAAQVVSCLKKMIPGYMPSVVALREAQVYRSQAVGM
jgi:FlaA1/EpsC-like NDP-sugar epimerase